MVIERPLERLSVLVVEDDYFLAEELKSRIKAGGAQAVRLSGSVEDACEQVKAGGFELALVDINIRGHDDYSVADELRRRKVPFAFVTGYDRNILPKRFANVPLWGKPLNPDSIARDIAALWKNV